MKILIYILRYKGGVGRVIKSLKPELEKLGNEIKIISREDDLDCFSLKDSFKKLKKDIKKRNYDILLTNDWSIALPFIFKKNHFSLFHGLEQHGISKVIQKKIGKMLENNLMVVGSIMLKRFPKAILTENGINPKKFYNMKKERRYLGWIKKETEGITKKEVKLLAKKYNLKLSIAETIHPNKMNEWYNSLKVFISMPLPSAGFNLCWVEAKKSGVPEIIGNDNGIGINNINKTNTVKHQAKMILKVLNEGGKK